MALSFFQLHADSSSDITRIQANQITPFILEFIQFTISLKNCAFSLFFQSCSKLWIETRILMSSLLSWLNMKTHTSTFLHQPPQTDYPDPHSWAVHRCLHMCGLSVPALAGVSVATLMFKSPQHCDLIEHVECSEARIHRSVGVWG